MNPLKHFLINVSTTENSQKNRPKNTLIKIFFFSGSYDPPQKFPFLTLTISVRLAALFIVPAYTGTILSIILNPIAKVPFNDLKEFVEDGSFQLGYPYQSLSLDSYSQVSAFKIF